MGRSFDSLRSFRIVVSEALRAESNHDFVRHKDWRIHQAFWRRTAPAEPVTQFLNQFRDGRFSGERTQLAYPIPSLPLPA